MKATSPHLAAQLTAGCDPSRMSASARPVLAGMEVATRRLSMRLFPVVAAGVIAAVQIGAAAVKVHVDIDKAFDFRQARTWAWAVPTAGHVMVARTPTDDPDAIQKLAEPIVMDAVIKELPARGMSHTTQAPELTLKYYLLLTIGSAAQTVGQFLPPVTQWGVPPFMASTQSLKVIQQGSLALDFSAKEQIVWRGVAAAEIKPGLPQEKRAALIREAVHEILKRYPQQKK
jgi:hypothetical protein